MSATRIPGADLSPSTGKLDAERREVAKGLEAYFLRQVFSELTKDGGGLGLAGGGFAGSTFGEMLNDALANAVAESGGLGIAKELAPTIVGDATGSGAAQALHVPSLEASVYGGSTKVTSSSGAPAMGGPLGAAMRARAAYGSTSSVLQTAPLQGAITSRFGARTDPITGAEAHHDGLDLAAPEGTSVKSAGPGVVLRAETEPGYGNVVVVDHGNGVETRYAHLSALHVKAGDRVAAGTEVGLVGSTGRSTGPHLHFEVRKGGKSVDPTTALSPLAHLR